MTLSVEGDKIHPDFDRFLSGTDMSETERERLRASLHRTLALMRNLGVEPQMLLHALEACAEDLRKELAQIKRPQPGKTHN